MILEHQKIKIDINSLYASSVRLIEHNNDNGIRFVDLEFYANSINIPIPDTATATATFVTDGILISDEIPCEIDNGIVVIPIDNSTITTRSGIMSVEVTITDTVESTTDGTTTQLTTILNTPHAFKIRITPSIKDDAQISENTFGTTAEILKEVAIARGDYKNLDERFNSKLDNKDGIITENKLVSELSEKINSKAKESLFIKQSSTQLIKLADIDTTINGLHIVIKNNHISIKGTAESGIYSSIGIDAGISEFNANTDYTISVQNVIDNTPETDYIGILYSGQSIPIIENDNFRNINFTETTALSLNWNIQPGTYDKEFDFQIELGTERTTFEPYYVVENVANNSISMDKLSEDIQDNLNVINTELPNKAEQSSLLNKASYYQFEDITGTTVSGFYNLAFSHNSASSWECIADFIECQQGDIFRVTSTIGTDYSDYTPHAIVCYDENKNFVSKHFGLKDDKITTYCNKIFVVPEGVKYIAFNSWLYNDMYKLVVEKVTPFTDEYGLIANSLVSSIPSFELWGKSIYSDGDSIAQGSKIGNRSYAHLLADKYNMTLTSEAVGNTTLAVQVDENGNGDGTSIYERVVSNITSDSQYDVIILDGGTNDITKLSKGTISLGVITDGVDEDFDTSTILGALEGICKHLNTVQLTAKKLFIFVTNRVEMPKLTKDTNSKMKQVLNKWGIPYVDLSEVNSLARWNDTVADKYYVDDIHPNFEAHKEFYLPYIEKALLYGGYIGSGGSAESTNSNGSYTLTDTDKTEIADIIKNEYEAELLEILGGDEDVTE